MHWTDFLAGMVCSAASFGLGVVATLAWDYRKVRALAAAYQATYRLTQQPLYGAADLAATAQAMRDRLTAPSNVTVRPTARRPDVAQPSDQRP